MKARRTSLPQRRRPRAQNRLSPGREEGDKRVFRAAAAGYHAVGAGLVVWYLTRRSWYLMAQSIGTIAVLWAVIGLMHWLKIRPVYSYYTVTAVFLFAAYTLGTACEWYKIVPGYDKLLHTISGTYTMMLALPLFYALKAGHRVERSDCLLACVFSLTTALAVAGVWELAEYMMGLVTPLDPQNVQATGVSDTMQDMLVCTLGALMALPPLVNFYRTGEGGLLYSGVSAFIERNLIKGA